MAEVAGLVLGGVPLILYFLDNYHKFIEPGKNILRYEDMLSNIRNDIFTQQQLFYRTVEMLGLRRPKYGQLEERLQSLYPEEYVEFMHVVKRMEDIVRQLMTNLDLNAEGNPISRDECPSRMNWEWKRVKRSFRSREREKLIDKLQDLNTTLRICLERPEIPSGDSNPRVQALQARFNPQYCQTVRQQACEVKKTLDSCWQCCCSDHRMSLDINWHSNQPTPSPVFEISLSFDEVCRGPNAVHQPRWQKTRMEVQDNSPSCAKTSNEVDVLGTPLSNIHINVASRPSPGSGSRSRSFLPHLFDRRTSRTPSPLPKSSSTVSTSSSPTKIQSLCKFMQDVCKGQDGLGFLVVPGDTRRVQITPLTRSVVSQIEVLSLKSLLSPNQLPVGKSLSRRKRFETAAAAAWAALLLCGTPWLTETWNKDGLHFFLEGNASSADFPGSNPCILKIPSQNTTTTNTANDLDRFYSRTIRNKAIFALGILLIELCLDQSFDDLSKATSPQNNQRTILDDFDVANDLIDKKVFREAGKSYGNACARCIRFEFPGETAEKDFQYAEFRRDFYNLVVAPVQATFSTIPR